jgi:hypothetical protein
MTSERIVPGDIIVFFRNVELRNAPFYGQGTRSIFMRGSIGIVLANSVNQSKPYLSELFVVVDDGSVGWIFTDDVTAVNVVNMNA